MELTTTWGQPTLKVRGKMFACIASHKSAEPNTLVVKMDFANRDALIEEDPAAYYLKEHYIGYPCVLVRLSRVHPDALKDLIIGAHRYVSAQSFEEIFQAASPCSKANLPIRPSSHTLQGKGFSSRLEVNTTPRTTEPSRN